MTILDWAAWLGVGLALTGCNDAPSGPMRSRKAPAAQAPAPPSQAAPASIPEGVEITDAFTLRRRAKQPGARGLVVNVWASWCGSCRDEIPLLVQMHKTFAREGLELSFVSADQPADLPRALELMRSAGGPLPVQAVAPGRLGAFKRDMNPRWRGAIPATFLFDQTGKLRHFWEGPILEHEIAPVLQGYLAGEPIDGETRTAGEPPPE
ncbi:MAG: TlpA disulfide reductase family protein [Polyangiales bacterium]